jgi:hypothetical protein
MFAFDPSHVLHSGVLGSVAYGGHALRMAPDGHVLELVYIGLGLLLGKPKGHGSW